MSNFCDSLENKVFRMILKEVKGKKNILDIGCGSCEDVKVVGVDLHNWGFPDIGEKRKQEKITNEVQCLKADVPQPVLLRQLN